ncbi:biopolymer transporter ExbD [Chitinimonas viridis]|uniref:Biopolymer transporter ExbD n=2 Tax=Chitinimonas TaxID=240411 RepID=A0ABT8B8E3_9NEIS|nr:MULTISPECIES: biopolymer transporter ExbD [Chitinimonas]MBL8507678.1 biopolymer transporter ExbD [Chitinimonas sp.]MDN3577828.1 biopolymer transporter ExbD [Chitinimonas viridis]GLR11713.1 biopolymer transporter ExbD [Chitinimonas prasina]
MNFRRGRLREEPEINLIPLLDVMLVILIFLMATTTFSKFTEMKINLPTAEANKPDSKPAEIVISVSSNGGYAIDKQAISFTGVEQLAADLRKYASSDDTVVVINADGNASHQSVVNVMEAARMAGLGKLTFATQTPQ